MHNTVKYLYLCTIRLLVTQNKQVMERFRILFFGAAILIAGYFFTLKAPDREMKPTVEEQYEAVNECNQENIK